MGAFINKYNPLILEEGIQKEVYSGGDGTKALFDDGVFKSTATSDYTYQGTINVNTDFPLIASVTEGDWYQIINTVTDDAGVTYTNTGTSWVAGEEIYWDGTTWRAYGLAGIDKLSYFNDVVGVAETNTELQDSFDISRNRIKLSSNITLTKTTTCPSFCIIDCNGFTITTNGNTFILSSNTKLIGTVIGNMELTNGSCDIDSLKVTGNLTITATGITLNSPYITGTFTVGAVAYKTNIIAPRTTASIVDASNNANIVAPQLI